MTISVRRAVPSDADWMLPELKSFSAFYGTKRDIFPDDEFAKSRVKFLIDQHIIFVAEKNGTGIGFIAGLYTPHLFNPALIVLSEQLWWVKESHRGSRAGLMLLNAFTEFGKVNCDWMTMTLEANSPVNDACLKRRGFKLQERQYLMETT